MAFPFSFHPTHSNSFSHQKRELIIEVGGEISGSQEFSLIVFPDAKHG